MTFFPKAKNQKIKTIENRKGKLKKTEREYETIKECRKYCEDIT